MRVFIGLGSNLLEPVSQIQRACTALAQLDNSSLVAVSSLYTSAPVGPEGQPDYVNAVAELNTTLSASDLLSRLQSIESAQGRERGPLRWTARTLDLDILTCDDEVIDLPHLQVPHPRMKVRNFVLVPLAELAPDFVFPDGTALQAALADCPPHPLRRLT